MVSLNQIFNWFKTGLKPTESQFKETFSSFWHKSEKISGTQIDGIPVIAQDGTASIIKIWIDRRENLPAAADRAGTKTLYIALDEEEA
jgi:hypothetical protein